jgi:hypothetical protein
MDFIDILRMWENDFHWNHGGTLNWILMLILAATMIVFCWHVISNAEGQEAKIGATTYEDVPSYCIALTQQQKALDKTPSSAIWCI